MARTTFWFSERVQFHQNEKRLLLNKLHYDKNAYIRIMLLAMERYIYHIYFEQKLQIFKEKKAIQKRSSLFKLNIDTILEIKKYLSLMDCFQLMQTCQQMWCIIDTYEPILYQVSICHFAMNRNTPDYTPSVRKQIRLYNIWYHGYESIKYSSTEPPSFTSKSIIMSPYEEEKEQQKNGNLSSSSCRFLSNIYYSLLKEISCWLDNKYDHYRRYNVYPHGYNTASRCIDTITDSIQIQDYFNIIGMASLYDFLLTLFNARIKRFERYDYHEFNGSFNKHQVHNIYSCLKKLQPFWKPFDEHLDLDDLLMFFNDCLNDNIEFTVDRFCISATSI